MKKPKTARQKADAHRPERNPRPDFRKRAVIASIVSLVVAALIAIGTMYLMSK